MSLDIDLIDADRGSVFSANITHNMNRMAAEAGIYGCIWRPREHGITHAHQMIDPLAAGLAQMVTQKAKFEAFNPSNGWGSWEVFVLFCSELLQACRDHPDAFVGVYR